MNKFIRKDLTTSTERANSETNTQIQNFQFSFRAYHLSLSKYYAKLIHCKSYSAQSLCRSATWLTISNLPPVTFVKSMNLNIQRFFGTSQRVLSLIARWTADRTENSIFIANIAGGLCIAEIADSRTLIIFMWLNSRKQKSTSISRFRQKTGRSKCLLGLTSPKIPDREFRSTFPKFLEKWEILPFLSNLKYSAGLRLLGPFRKPPGRDLKYCGFSAIPNTL
jgi:hypothetical protein